MYAVNLGNGEIKIYNRNLDIDTKLPPGVFRVNCNPDSGFYLEMMRDFKVSERIYGDVTKKISLIMDSFEHSDRSIGVIFSGKKGLGKSLASRRLCELMQGNGYPIIVVDKPIRGTSQFIQSIDVPVVVLFDEFDKVFRDNNRHSCSDDSELRKAASMELLPLFDGLDSTKRLFIVNCNELEDVSSYLINRPGRFHYHFRFDYPTVDDISTYMQENVKKKYQDSINDVLVFAKSNRFNYDALRAICFEINQGHSFDEVKDYLNIYECFGLVRMCASIMLEGSDELYDATWIYDRSKPSIRFNIRIGKQDDHKHIGTIKFTMNDIVIKNNGDGYSMKPDSEIVCEVFYPKYYGNKKFLKVTKLDITEINVV